MPQTEAAALTRTETSVIDGREVRSVCQQSSNSFQTSSERPSLSAFAGFEGFSPLKTLKTSSDPDSLPNGSVPVSTCEARISTRTHQSSRDMYLIYHHTHCVYVGLLRGFALIEAKP